MNYPNLQLVVVNDGTPAEKAKQFQRLSAKLSKRGHIFFSQSNGGPSKARNTAAALAKHKTLVFFDADNLPKLNFLNDLARGLEMSSYDSISAPYFICENLDVPIEKILTDSVYQPAGGFLPASLLKNYLGDTCSIIRRSTFEAIGGFPEDRRAFEDWHFFFRLIAAGYKHSVYPEPLFYYRVHPDSRSALWNREDGYMQFYQNISEMPRTELEFALRVLSEQKLKDFGYY